MEFILNVLYIYVTLYTLCFLALALRNLNDKVFEKELKHAEYETKGNLAVIVYAHNNKKTLDKLVTELKNQDYPLNKFRVFVLLDNCTDDSQALFTEENLFHVIDIKGVGTIGKDQAVATLLEKLSENDYVDSYVFIDADRSIAPNFLTIANAALKKNNVISGETIIDFNSLGIVDKIKAAYQKYHMNVIRKARTLFGLAAMADSGIFLINKQIVDEIGNVDFKSSNSELRYSLLLSKIKCRCIYNPNIKSSVHPANYIFKRPKISYRLDLFKDCIPQLFSKNFAFSEHICSLLYPNLIVLLIIFAGLFKHSLNYHFIVDVKIVALTFTLLVITFGISLINAKLTKKEIGFLCAYPLYSICHIIRNFPPIRFVVNKIFDKESEKNASEKFVVDVVITTAKKINLNYKLEFIQKDGMSKVKLIRKNKHFSTSSHIRMIDALQEIKLILDDHNATLRICSCCSHFQPSIDGTTNMLRGYCTNQYPSPSITEDQKPTVVWNTCSSFCPAKLNNLMSEIIQASRNENEKNNSLYKK